MARRAGLSTTLLLSAAAVAMALVAIFGEEGSFTALTVVAALAGLVPWALVAGGVSVPPTLFAACGLVPAAVIILVERNPGGVFPLLLVVVWVTRSSRHAWLIGATVGTALAYLVGLAVLERSAHETGMVYFVGGLGISWLAGLMLRRQEALTAEVQAMHELQVEQLAATERTRIAREVHDVVAHSLTVVMLNVTGARRALVTQRSGPTKRSGAEQVGRSSLDSIRQVMGLLRESGSGLDLPQPGAIDLPGLIDGYRSAGSPIEASIDRVVDQLDPAAQLVLYRVVQESLSNVMQHAPGAPARVELAHDRDDERVRLSVVNGPPTSRPAAPTERTESADCGSDAGFLSPGKQSAAGARTGLGVRGMGERVRATGGVLQAGPSAEGGWRVTATIPTRVRTDSPATDEDGARAWAPTAR
ncbi:MAG: sensor histidine kinase [Ilumatobacteraceae bacterium]